MALPKRGARSYWRGHPITWDGVKWVFDDTGEPVSRGGPRPCAKCGRVFEGSAIGDPDPCLGILPGVDNACCGHGIPEMAYIRFTNGVCVEGFTRVTHTPAWKEEP